MDPGIIPASSDDYVVSLHRRLGLELADRRAALGLSAYALGKIAERTCPRDCWSEKIQERIPRRSIQLGAYCQGDIREGTPARNGSPAKA